ncbi:MAG: DUF2938 domain-containing protein [Gemmobacter sp.]
MEFLLRSLVIGAGATILFDLWGRALHAGFGVALPDWGLVGRWFAHCGRGRFIHDDIAASRAVPGEATIGWLAHYAIGILYGALVLAIWGLDWGRAPTLPPALIVGVVTVGAGWFILSPGMGNGMAASRATDPWRTRGLQLAAHVVFGIGLYLSALAGVAILGRAAF